MNKLDCRRNYEISGVAKFLVTVLLVNYGSNVFFFYQPAQNCVQGHFGLIMVCSVIYVTDLKGKVLISRNYRGDVNSSVIETFRTLL